MYAEMFYIEIKEKMLVKGNLLFLPAKDSHNPSRDFPSIQTSRRGTTQGCFLNDA